MARINPTYYPDTRTWETDDGVSARSVAALKAKLGGRVTIENYYPNGYGFIIRERPKSESIFQQSVEKAVAAIARQHEAKPDPAALARDLVAAGEIEYELGPVHLPEDIKRIPELPPEGNTATKDEVAPPPEPEEQPDAPLAPEPEFDPYVKPPLEKEPVEALQVRDIEDIIGDEPEPIDVPVFLKKPKSVPKPKVPRKRSQKAKVEHYYRTRALESFAFPRVHWDTQLPILMKLFQEGKSTKDIAMVIRCSENSVIGKLHRLGYKIKR
jgi:hypothetical protein